MIAKTKQSRKTVLLILSFLLGIGLYGAINAWNLIFTDVNQESLNASFSQIHFESPGNSFGGGVFWLPVKSQNPVTISIDNGNASKPTKICTNQIRGLYYNDARGARLRPLDQDTLKILQAGDSAYNQLSITGGFFTTCGAYNDKYSIYGYIEYTISGTPVTKSYIMAGVTMNYNSNSYGNQFKDGFQYFNNKTPLGYIWDSIGGIGFIGGQISGSAELLDFINSGGSINSAFSLNTDNGFINSSTSWGFDSATTGDASNLMWNLMVQGNSIISRAIDVLEKKSLFENLDKRTVLISSTDINSSTIINIAKKNAENLCRGIGYQTTSTNTEILVGQTKNIVCYENSPNLYINLNGHNDDLRNKTIILKNSNLTLKKNMDETTPPLDLFIDGGNLYVEGVNSSSNLATRFNEQGFPTNVGSGINQGLYIKGNIIINGLIIGGNPSSVSSIDNKMHIHGRFVSLNSLGIPTTGRIEQVADVLNTGGFTPWIGLEDVFKWQCYWLNGKGNDRTDCSNANKISPIPLVILDGSFPSEIIK